MPQMLTYIIGSRFHAGAPQAVLRLRRGEELVLLREPSNPHDRNAVAVHAQDGQKLGYVPRQDAPSVAKELDLELPIRATVRTAGGNNIDISWEA